MRLSQSNTLQYLTYILMFVFLILFGITLSWSLSLFLFGLLWFVKRRGWLQVSRYQALCLDRSGYGEWQTAEAQYPFQVGKFTFVTPFLIILHYYILPKSNLTTPTQAFYWIMRDSCSLTDFRDLTLKLKLIQSRFELTTGLE